MFICSHFNSPSLSLNTFLTVPFHFISFAVCTCTSHWSRALCARRTAGNSMEEAASAAAAMKRRRVKGHCVCHGTRHVPWHAAHRPDEDRPRCSAASSKMYSMPVHLTRCASVPGCPTRRPRWLRLIATRWRSTSFQVSEAAAAALVAPAADAVAVTHIGQLRQARFGWAANNSSSVAGSGRRGRKRKGSGKVGNAGGARVTCLALFMWQIFLFGCAINCRSRNEQRDWSDNSSCHLFCQAAPPPPHSPSSPPFIFLALPAAPSLFTLSVFLCVCCCLLLLSLSLVAAWSEM